MKKIEQVREHLKKHNTITGKEAWLNYGYYRLSDGILKLRREGMNIVTHMVKTPDGEHAKYELVR